MNWLRKAWHDFGEGSEWRVIMLTYLGAAGVAGAAAVGSSNTWMALLDAALAGWCLHGAFTTRMMKWYRDAFLDTSKALREMQDLNRELIENRVRMHLAKVELVETDDDGPAKTIN